jgi:hypothetical protein
VPTPARLRAQHIERITAARAEHATLLRASTVLHRQLACLLALRAGGGRDGSGGGGGGGGGGGDDAAAASGDGGGSSSGGGGGGGGGTLAERVEAAGAGSASAAFAVADKEKRYGDALRSVVAERELCAGEEARFDGAAMALQRALDAKEAHTAAVEGALTALRRQVAAGAVDTRTGARLPPALVERLEAADRDKAAELAGVQLRAIHMGNQAAELDARLATKQQLADGLDARAQQRRQHREAAQLEPLLAAVVVGAQQRGGHLQ